MNVENILKVADAIESRSLPGIGFNMNYFASSEDVEAPVDKLGVADCGTVACIAGWTELLFPPASGKTFSNAAKTLGIRESQTEELFYARNHPRSDGEFGPLDDITPEQAVSTLRHLAATGEVDWTAAAPAISSQPTQEG